MSERRGSASYVVGNEAGVEDVQDVVDLHKHVIGRFLERMAKMSEEICVLLGCDFGGGFLMSEELETECYCLARDEWTRSLMETAL